ncbi:hypothetical protein BRD00_00510 [Halobacteriales archaeon QS_8_69_26]|nr:MAG: hypothetical protein BRD00_00510 [Halobacteriales archaeon QS_8_69_26]
MTEERSNRRDGSSDPDDVEAVDGSTDRANGRTDGRIGRRSVLKAIGASAAVGAGLFSVPAAATAGPEGVPVTPDETEVPNPDVQVRKVARDVQELSRHYPVLTLPEDTVLGYIDDSGLSGRERGEARKALADLRSEFPVKREREGNVTWLTLANDRGRGTPSQEHADKFEIAGTAFAKGATGLADDEGPSIQQWGNIHRKMTRNACEEMGVSSDTADEIAAYADDPDDPDVDIGVPSWIPHADTVEDGLEHALNEFVHHFGQYYDEDAFEVYHDDDHAESLGAVGGAPTAADWHMDRAHSYCCSSENEFLGKATHYPQDMGVPLHTGMGWEQVNLEIYYDVWSLSYDYDFDPMYWLHSEYEEFVSDNWSYFEYDYESHCGDDCFYYYPIDDVEQSVRDLAAYTGDYSYEVYHRIVDEGDVDWSNWSSDTRSYMFDITENCLNETGHYTRGFIHDVKW